MASGGTFFSHMLKKEAFFVLGPERVRRLRENPNKVVFKYNTDGTPFSLSVLVPDDPNLIQTLTDQSKVMREKTDAEAYATVYPNRKRALTIAKMFVLKEEGNDVQITFLPCTLSHFNHFFERTPYRDWLDI